ncbi:MAG: hypothetical protein ABNH53_01955 [Henriciella sp.]|jgi:hypothetical protein
MSQMLAVVLRNVRFDLLKAWLHERHINHNQAPSDAQTQREFAGKLYLELLDDSASYARLANDAKRIEALKDSRFDWLFARTLPQDLTMRIETFAGRDRALWLLLNEPELFERIERRASFTHYANAKTKHTRFETVANIAFNPTHQQRADFEAAIQSIFRKHDGSAKFAEIEVEELPTLNGRRSDLVTVRLSRLPNAIEHFSEDGDRRSDAMRQVTDVHIAYESETGSLFVASSRGGYPVRMEASEAFASILLGVTAKPTVLKGERFNLNRLPNAAELPLLADVHMKAIDLIELIIRHPSLENARMQLRDTEGLAADVMDTLFGEFASLADIESATIRVYFEAPEDGDTEPKPMNITLNADGSSNLRGDDPLELAMRDALPKLWGMSDG